MPTELSPVRIAGPADIPAIVATLTDAFLPDPLWAWSFGDPRERQAEYAQWWRLFVEGAVGYGSVYLTPGAGSVAMWLPPGAVELAPAEQDALPATIERLAGAYAGRVTATCDALEEHHPEQPHWYLSMLGTRSDERGRGQGMALLRYCLGVLDAAGQPTYLESSNPANNKRYAGAGFQPRQVFTIGADGPEVTTFWRPAGG